MLSYINVFTHARYSCMPASLRVWRPLACTPTCCKCAVYSAVQEMESFGSCLVLRVPSSTKEQACCVLVLVLVLVVLPLIQGLRLMIAQYWAEVRKVPLATLQGTVLGVPFAVVRLNGSKRKQKCTAPVLRRYQPCSCGFKNSFMRR